MAIKNVKFQAATKAFGKAMRHHRSKLGLSQEALADRAQLDRSYMSQIERGIKNVTLNSIWRIAEALEVSPSDLLRLTEDIFLGKATMFADGGEERDPRFHGTGLGRPSASAGYPESVAWQHRPSLAVGKQTVLLCDIDENLGGTLERLLQSSGFQTMQIASETEALKMILNLRVDVVVTGFCQHRGKGLELLESVRKSHPRLPVFLLNNDAGMSFDEARDLGALGVANAPWDAPQVVATLKSALPV